MSGDRMAPNKQVVGPPVDAKRKRGRPPKGTPRSYPARVVVELDEPLFTELEDQGEKASRTPALQAQHILREHLTKKT